MAAIRNYEIMFEKFNIESGNTFLKKVMMIMVIIIIIIIIIINNKVTYL
jgi:preprotein translocase subunit SecG